MFAGEAVDSNGAVRGIESTDEIAGKSEDDPRLTTPRVGGGGDGGSTRGGVVGGGGIDTGAVTGGAIRGGDEAATGVPHFPQN